MSRLSPGDLPFPDYLLVRLYLGREAGNNHFTFVIRRLGQAPSSLSLAHTHTCTLTCTHVHTAAPLLSGLIARRWQQPWVHPLLLQPLGQVLSSPLVEDAHLGKVGGGNRLAWLPVRPPGFSRAFISLHLVPSFPPSCLP